MASWRFGSLAPIVANLRRKSSRRPSSRTPQELHDGRTEVQLYDPVEGMALTGAGDPAPALNANFAGHAQCARSGIMLGVEWDRAHRNTPWRVWRIGCPSLIVDLRTGALVGYKLPECGHRDTVVCEVDSEI